MQELGKIQNLSDAISRFRRGELQPLTPEQEAEIERQDREALALQAVESRHQKAKSFGIPERLVRAIFSDVERGPFDDGTPKGVAALADAIAEGESLYIHGSPGCGKSHVAAAGAWKWWRKYENDHDTYELRPFMSMRRTPFVLWAEWTMAIGKLREEARGDDRMDFENDLREAELLVLDDLGPTARATPFALDEIRVVVASRYNDCKQTVITSNYSPQELVGKIGLFGADREITESFSSRLAAIAKVREIRGPDRRLAK